MARLPLTRIAAESIVEIVRTLEEYDMPNHLRITVGTGAQIEELIDAVHDVAGVVDPC